MSELGNHIRHLRGDSSQIAFAQKTNLSLRTICKLEAGESARLETLLRISKACGLEDGERLELIVSWLKLELGDDFSKLIVQPKTPGMLRDADNLPGKIQVKLRDVSKKHQEQIHLALQRPEVLRCLENLNDLYEAVRGTK
jgi:hypothetical protein